MYVDDVATLLRSSGITVFYDLFEEASLWGKNLYDYLTDIYKDKSLFTIMFISEHYSKKLWTNHERQAMQARTFYEENKEYILPARFDDTEIPGILPTIKYVDLRMKSPDEFVKLIKEKLISSGEAIPAESVRNPKHHIDYLPNNEKATAKVSIVNNSDIRLAGIRVTAICENGTYKEEITHGKGEAVFDIQIKRQYTLLISSSEYPAVIVDNWDMTNNIVIKLEKIENVGSIICHSTCYIPELQGRLNIILDTSFRTYLYADNIAINGGLQQPAPFELNKPFILEDADGRIMEITVKYIKGRTSLVQFVYKKGEI
jgi:hypothetical protein